MEWLKKISLLLSGGVVWEFLKFIFPILNRKLDEFKKARELFFNNINPILKSADELYGKLFSLASEDFATFINEKNSISKNPSLNRLYVYYLFAQFFAQLENVRIQNQYLSISSLKKGRNLLRFIETVESRQFRLLDRSTQRVIGEILIEGASSKFKIMSLNEFLKRLDKPDPELNKWIILLEEVLNKADDKDVRQRILLFGVIVAALIDCFDPNYKIVRRRGIYLNKLSPATKEKISGQLLKHYLPFVKNKENYFLDKL